MRQRREPDGQPERGERGRPRYSNQSGCVWPGSCKEWSQADLAARLDVTPAAVSQFETGVTRPGTRRAGPDDQRPGRPCPVLLAAGHRNPRRLLPVAAPDLGHPPAPRPGTRLHRPRPGGDRTRHPDCRRSAYPGYPSPAWRPPTANSRKQPGRYGKRSACPAARYPNVAETLEDHGILVIRLPLDTADVDAFSLPFHDRPVVVLGTDKNDRARSRFDGAHELGHLVVHGDQIWGVKEVEHQAHAFAAAFLMPADDIRDELPDRADWPVLFQLKQKWQVSLAALLMRARTLGRMSENNYLTAVKAASARGWRRIEPVPLGRPEHPTCLKRLLATPAGRQSLELLPHDVVQALVTATAS